MKTKHLVNTATQVSGVFESELNLIAIPDNISSSLVNFEKPYVNSYIYNETPPYNPIYYDSKYIMTARLVQQTSH